MKRLLFSVIVVLFASCSSPLDKPYKEETLQEDVLNLKNTLSEEEVSMITGLITLKAFGGKKIIGKTYGDLLQEAKEMKAEMEKKKKEEEALAEQAKKDELDRIKRLGEVLTASMYDKGYYEYKYRDYLTYKFAFQNKSGKDIKAIKGSMVISDLFDEKIKEIGITYDDGIPADSTINYSAQTSYNSFNDSDVTFKNKQMEDLKMLWKPEKVIFSDGSIIE